jgi:sulfide:quinone oxidoreductase
MKSHYQVVVVGGGTAGIMTAAQLKRRDRGLSIAIVEPSETHSYQPAWTLVGAGAFDFKKTRRPESSLIPKGVDWIKDRVTDFQPDRNCVTTASSGEITYDALVVAAGIQNDLDALPGLRDALERENVCSNYLDPEKSFEALKRFKGGNALFTQPATPIRCGGAPQKIMYLAEEYFVKSGVRDTTNVIFATPGTVIFGTPEFAEELTRIIKRKRVRFKPFYKPIRIDPDKQEVTFLVTKPDSHLTDSDMDTQVGEHLTDVNTVTIRYDLLHLAPPQSAPDFIKNSPFAHREGPNKGWMNVDIHTLRNPDFPNVFGLGDSAALPTAKTGAAIRKQAPVVVENVLRALKQMSVSEERTYEGYSSCPIVTGYGKMLLCEFKYGNVRSSDPFLSRFVNTAKEQWSMWILKKYGLPWLYWNMMMKGRM